MIILWVVCTSGHLLSTAEVESALVEHEAVVEAAVVSRPHPVKGESLYCFVTLTEGVSFSRTLEAQLKKQGMFWFYLCKANYSTVTEHEEDCPTLSACIPHRQYVSVLELMTNAVYLL